jgi:hypothetical protein
MQKIVNHLYSVFVAVAFVGQPVFPRREFER